MSSHGLNPNIEVPNDVEHSVSFFLSLFFTDSLLKHLVDCTNSRAELELEKTLGEIGPDGKLPTSLSQWKMCTFEEMKKVIGILFVMAVNRKPEIKHYWSQNVLYKSEFFQRPECLSRDRFLLIIKFLRSKLY